MCDLHYYQLAIEPVVTTIHLEDQDDTEMIDSLSADEYDM